MTPEHEARSHSTRYRHGAKRLPWSMTCAGRARHAIAQDHAGIERIEACDE